MLIVARRKENASFNTGICMQMKQKSGTHEAKGRWWKMEKSVLEMNEEYKKKEKCKKMQTKRKQTNKRKGK